VITYIIPPFEAEYKPSEEKFSLAATKCEKKQPQAENLDFFLKKVKKCAIITLIIQ
jgi:hypothetical protein